jgi:hypothetical protein
MSSNIYYKVLDKKGKQEADEENNLGLMIKKQRNQKKLLLNNQRK